MVLLFLFICFLTQAQEREHFFKLDPKKVREFVGQKHKSFNYPNKLLQLYANLGYACLWVCYQENLEIYKQLLQEARRHGLWEQDYELKPVEDQLLYELLTTDKLIKLAYHTYYGRLKPASIFKGWTIPNKRDIVIEKLSNLIKEGRIKDLFIELAPSSSSYWFLVREGELYYALSNIEWKPIRLRSPLKQGDISPCIDEVRYRLFLLGELREYKPSWVFDQEVAQAVKSFQERHGIKATGVLDKETLRELNIKPAERLKQIYINLEKHRWLHDIEQGAIVVNIPSFELFYFKMGELKLYSRAIVGKHYKEDFRPTPMLYSEVQSITINPKWYVPVSIAVKDIKPKVLKDPQYLSKKGIRVFIDGEEVDPLSVDWVNLNEENFPYILVQEAGPKNSLGRIKFNFPNPFAVFLHDTPEKHLFRYEKRAFSSGCIRVEKAKELALHLLGEGWDQSRLNNLISTGKTLTIPIKGKTPLYILYFTAFEKDGKLNFREDLYQYDRIIGSYLFGGGS